MVALVQQGYPEANEASEANEANMPILDPQLLAQRKKIQMEIMLKDSDLKRTVRAMMDAEIALRDIKHKQAQLQSDFILKENQLKKLNGEKIQMQAELVKFRHQMNSLGR